MKATSSSNRVKSYEETIDALNNLQSSPHKSVRQRDNSNKLQRTIDFLERSGVSLIQLDDLSVIHVTGTKGKWFSDKITTSNSYKALIFNSTGNRNSKTHLQILQKIGYDKVHLDFVSNKSSSLHLIGAILNIINPKLEYFQ
ncbi:PREDICTED: folylpolyglutamate synthase, mitochondrial-like [Nicrophorus vespilloides]|uniref:Folylpolyglutamate synthase, mitochondrial-like n=1 Tax=Nicrophorus vespilloides TaxID=110193 RepID=A0ABM1NA74_NICVS|nr:PREDICTED: folylpolyglutamate synthase, mitochondrial-like [Nicrophorus vespilloides]